MFRGGGLVGLAGRSPYRHAGLACWWDTELMCLEFRELLGGRAVTLSSQVRRRPGLIDVYRVDCEDDRAEWAAHLMRTRVGNDYNYRGVLKAAVLHLPFVRFLSQPNLHDNDRIVPGAPEYCSQGVAISYRIAAGLDLVPNLADSYTEPGDLGRSGLLSLLHRGLVP